MKQFEIVWQNFTVIALITFHHLSLIIFFVGYKDNIRTESLKLCWHLLQKSQFIRILKVFIKI